MKKKVNKKIGASRRQASAADVKKAKDTAIVYVWAIFLTVMRDKEGYGIKRLRRLWERVNDLSDSISKGYVNINDLVHTLEEEAGIVIR